jgi:hypothetical protein
MGRTPGSEGAQVEGGKAARESGGGGEVREVKSAAGPSRCWNCSPAAAAARPAWTNSPRNCACCAAACTSRQDPCGNAAPSTVSTISAPVPGRGPGLVPWGSRSTRLGPLLYGERHHQSARRQPQRRLRTAPSPGLPRPHQQVPVGRTLLVPSYFAGSCGGAPPAVVKEYVENQKWPY